MRKIGVGFNYPRVLYGQLQWDYRKRWDLGRNLSRLRRPTRELATLTSGHAGGSLVETMRLYFADELKPRPKR